MLRNAQRLNGESRQFARSTSFDLLLQWTSSLPNHLTLPAFVPDNTTYGYRDGRSIIDLPYFIRDHPKWTHDETIAASSARAAVEAV